MPLTHAQWVELQERRKQRIAESPCPLCNASPGQPCLAKNGGPRRSLHMERNGNTKPRGPRSQPKYPLDPGPSST